MKWLRIIIPALVLCASFFFDKLAVSIQQLPISLIAPFLLWVTNFGSAIAVLFIMTSILLWDEHKREWIPALWISLFFVLGAVYALKFLVGRARPTGAGEVLFGFDDYSFPSAHAASSFAPLPILARFLTLDPNVWVEDMSGRFENSQNNSNLFVILLFS